MGELVRHAHMPPIAQDTQAVLKHIRTALHN